ncbi:MAG: neutral/alkaline non-lysosomal ceramidase N-terminal domain-containing protein [Acidobacteriota bacterium]
MAEIESIRWPRIFIALLIAQFFCILTAAQAAEPEWKVGLASVKITPEWPVLMAGYAARTQMSQSVHDDLHAKVLALEDSGGHRAVLVTADLIGFRSSIAEAICADITERTGLTRAQILLNASHTHAGPMVGISSQGQSGYGEDYESEAVQNTLRYNEQLREKVVDAVLAALGEMKPARLSKGLGVCSFVMNRREFTPRGVVLGVNPRGPVDRSVPILRIDVDDRPAAVLFGYASHNTTLGGDNLAISGDYAGPAQGHVEARYPGVQAMFMLGCAGDANPYPRGTFELAAQHGRALGEEVSRLMQTDLQPVQGPLTTVFGRADLPLQPVPPRAELERLAKKGQSYQRATARRLLETLDGGEEPPRFYSAPLSLWQFGSDLTLVGLSGEVVVDYVHLLEKALGPLNLWVAAYCNDVFGYVPSARVLSETGYETRGLYHGSIGVFTPEVQDVVVREVVKLARQAGRQ